MAAPDTVESKRDSRENEILAAFREAFRRHPAAVAIVTADPGSGPVALTATSVSSVSAAPAMLMFSASLQSSATEGVLGAETVVVHLLEESDVDLAKLCATSKVDRFHDTATWARLTTGEPYYLQPAIKMRVRISSRIPAGNAFVIVAEVLEIMQNSSTSPNGPLVYHERRWHTLGHRSEIS